MSDATHFERLGLPRRYALDEADLERAYLGRSRALHPDYHQTGSEAEQRASLELTSLLNLAYSTLKHPFQRADYLLTLEGGPSAAEHRQMSPDFLEEMLELRMEIQELRSEGGGSSKLAPMEESLEARRAKLIESLGRDFEMLDKVTDAERRLVTRRGIRQTLNAAKYIEGLLTDLRAD